MAKYFIDRFYDGMFNRFRVVAQSPSGKSRRVLAENESISKLLEDVLETHDLAIQLVPYKRDMRNHKKRCRR